MSASKADWKLRITAGCVVGAINGAACGRVILSVQPDIAFWPYVGASFSVCIVANIIVMAVLCRIGVVR